MIRRLLRKLEWSWGKLLGRRDPMILMYHRVADAPVDPWGLAVSPDVFDQQMKVLAETRMPVPLDWLAAELKAGRRPQGAVAVTFDDGYLDILENAKPSLVRYNIPATVFIVSGMVGDARGFWWDQLAEVVFGAPAVPGRLDLSFVTPEIEAARASGDRARLNLALWAAVRVKPLDMRYEAVAEIAAAFGIPSPVAPPIMTEAQLHELIDGGLVTLGVHTVTHASLPSLSTEEQRAEIGECKALLETLLGEPNRRLAYPFGDFDARSIAIANDLDFEYAVSVNPGVATRWSERFRLPRFDIKNWPEAEFRKRLAWFS